MNSLSHTETHKIVKYKIYTKNSLIDLNWSGSGQGLVAVSYEYNNEPSDSTQYREFDLLSSY